MRYELSKDLETGNAIIDNEHRELFDAVNKLLDACSKGKGRDSLKQAAQFLINYVDKHFSHEEQLQQDSKYPGITAHKLFHSNYKAELNKIISQIPPTNASISDVGKLNNHISVLINHIKIEDKKLSAFLNNN